MNKLSAERQTQVLKSLVEGNSVRATSRMVGVDKNTVLKLIERIGKACAKYMDEHLRNLTCRNIQCDEIWSYCYAKEKNVPKQVKGTFGYCGIWTWTAIDAETKLVICWLLGNRDLDTATLFINDLASRLDERVQLTTDGLSSYIGAVEDAFGADIDFAQLIKLYHETPTGEVRYSPADCIGTKKNTIQGQPDHDKISTSYVERQNLTMRMCMRRFTRLTNGFSKKVENHFCSIAIHFMHYNFCRIHQSLRITPAMAAGVSDHVWDVEELVALIK